MAAWAGSQRRATVAGVAEEAVDPELLERWVRFLKKKPDNYSTLVRGRRWSPKTGRGGREAGARVL